MNTAREDNSVSYNAESRVTTRDCWPPLWLREQSPAKAAAAKNAEKTSAEASYVSGYPDKNERPKAPETVIGYPIDAISCPNCRQKLDEKQRCWRCHDRICVCGRMTGSAFLATCLQCDVASPRACNAMWH